MFYDYLTRHMGISPRAARLARDAEKGLSDLYRAADDTAAVNQLKVLRAMQKARLSDTHFTHATGYGYNDAGREAMEDIFAAVFGGEAALVRPQLISGTHALACALFGNLRPGDLLYAPTGRPYDTLTSVIGLRESVGSLRAYGVQYAQTDLTPDGGLDYPAITAALKAQPAMAALQRSKGYSWRPAFTIAQLRELIGCIRAASPRTIILVDNCYGEFTETEEPLAAGADLVAGSLIKNPGGGLAPGGGYIVGRADCVEAAAARLTAPGLGREVGPTFGMARALLQGLFIAPQVVGGALKGAMLAAAAFDALGFAVNPGPLDTRSDIVQAIQFSAPEQVLAFCRGIQKAAPVDSFVTPEAAPMPGYDAEVVMAAGAFIQGASIELSADGPLRPPYIAYMQGGLTEAHAKAGVAFALDAVMGR